jgi:hypothetical protein
MPGEIKFTFDVARNILFTEDNFELRTKQDVDEFFRINDEECRRHPGKFYLISNIDNLKIYAPVISYYGRMGKVLVEKYILGHARYATEPFARMAIRTAYSSAGVKCSIFEKKEEALEFLGL